MSLTIKQDYTIGAGDKQTFTNEQGILLSEATFGSPPSLRIDGTLTNTYSADFSAGGWHIGVWSTAGGFFKTSTVTIGAAGALRVSSAGAGNTTMGIGHSGWSANVYNNGVIEVTAVGEARGVAVSNIEGVFQNNGSLTVSSSRDSVYGAILQGGSLRNAGTISVSGASDYVSAVNNAGGTTGDFINTGSIIAKTSKAGAASVGVAWNEPFTAGKGWTNKGLIQADIALQVGGYASDPIQTFTNDGEMIGRVSFVYDPKADQFVNTGRVTGDIDLGVGDDSYDGGGTVVGVVYGGAGNDRLTGGGQADTFEGGEGADVMIGGGGIDTAAYTTAAAGVTVSLALFFPQDTRGAGGDTLSGFENLRGSRFADVLTGDGGANGFEGGAGDDTIRGGAGADTIDGGAGLDTAAYSGAAASYRWAPTLFGWSVTDQRSGSPDGSDSLANIETLAFTDRQVDFSRLDRPTALAADKLLRGANSSLSIDLSAKLASGAITAGQAVAQIVDAAGATTSVATLSYQFFTGATPTEAGLDYLVAPSGANPNNLNSAYYTTFNFENRYINFAANLGKVGEGKAAFQAHYGSLSLAEATKKAYGVIFGSAPSDEKVTALLANGKDLYFAAYGQDGLNGIGTKAAMVGWLLAEAEKGHTGVYAQANDALLTDLADGSASLGVDLVGAYGKAELSALPL